MTWSQSPSEARGEIVRSRVLRDFLVDRCPFRVFFTLFTTAAPVAQSGLEKETNN